MLNVTTERLKNYLDSNIWLFKTGRVTNHKVYSIKTEDGVSIDFSVMWEKTSGNITSKNFNVIYNDLLGFERKEKINKIKERICSK